MDRADIVLYYLNELKGPNPEDAWHSLREEGPECIPLLTEALKDAHYADIKAVILSVLYEYRDPRVVPLLAHYLADADAEVWTCAIDGLCTLGGQDALLALTTELNRCVEDNLSSQRKLIWLREAIDEIS